MTEDELKKLEELAGKATKGPWQIDYDYCDCGGEYPCNHPDVPFGLISGEDDAVARYLEEPIGADIEYIAYANPDRILRLVDRVRRLEAACNYVCHYYKIQTGNAELDKANMVYACKDALKEAGY